MKYDFICFDCNKIYEDIEQPINSKHIMICPNCGKEIEQDYMGKGKTLGFSSSCACAYGIDGSSGWAGGSTKGYEPVDFSGGDDGADEKLSAMIDGEY